MNDAPETLRGEPKARPWVAWALVAALAAGAAAAVGWLVLRAQSAPASVRPVVWDKESCAECKMAVSVPAFAAQLQTDDGRVLDFDDPGCLMTYLAEERPRVHALYFHALKGDHWLTRDEAGFLPGARSPMGYDLGAVPRGTPGALDFEQALRRVQDGGLKRGDH